MFEIYLTIGIFLIIIGLLGCCYFLKLLNNHGFNTTTITSLNECIITIFIGIFYIYCTMITTNQTEILIEMTNDDVFIIEENPTETPLITTTTTEPPNFDAENVPASSTTTTTTITTTVSNSIDKFLTNYQNLLHNLIQQQQQSSRKSRQYDFNKSQLNQTMNRQQCFDESLMKYSMFLYSYLHCVLSLIVTVVYQNSNRKSKLITKTLFESFLPIIIVLLINLTTTLDIPIDFQHGNSTIFDIIKQPINQTTIEHKNEVDSIISNIYRIVKSTTNHVQVRQPKSMEICPIPQLQKIIISIIVLLYFITILYVKIQQTQLKLQHKQFNFCLLAFSLLWLPLILEQFIKNFFYTTITNTATLSDIFLTLGNLNRFTIVVICYINGKSIIKRLNSIQPDT